LFFFLAIPFPWPALRLRNVAAHTVLRQIDQNFVAVISLVGDYLFDAAFVDQRRVGLGLL
jgi:hypothetical protein